MLRSWIELVLSFVNRVRGVKLMQRTLILLKPDCVQRRLVGALKDRIFMALIFCMGVVPHSWMRIRWLASDRSIT